MRRSIVLVRPSRPVARHRYRRRTAVRGHVWWLRQVVYSTVSRCLGKQPGRLSGRLPCSRTAVRYRDAPATKAATVTEWPRDAPDDYLIGHATGTPGSGTEEPGRSPRRARRL
jgi:hypothetical protein